MVSNIGKEIDIEKIRDFFMKRKKICIRKKGTKSKGFVWKLEPTKFYNQVTLSYEDLYTKKSIKLFPNGSIQVAGCSELSDCKRILAQLSTLFNLILEIDDFPHEKFKTVLINTNFSLNYEINLKELVKEVKKHEDIFKWTWNPDTYAAVILKFKPAQDMKQITVSIFGTGNVILTGAETLKEVVFGYQIINQLIYSHKEKIKVDKSEEKEVFNIFMGYKIPEMIEFLKKKNIASWAFTRSNNQIKF